MSEFSKEWKERKQKSINFFEEFCYRGEYRNWLARRGLFDQKVCVCLLSRWEILPHAGILMGITH